MRARRAWAALLAAVALAAALSPLIGAVPVPPAELVRAALDPAAADPAAVRILALRLPRLVLGLAAGAALALAGAAFQTLLGNPLATPYTVGVASAGAFGAFLVLATSTGTAGGAAPQAAALAASTAELLLLAALARRARWGRTAVVLAGVVLNFLFASGTVLVRLLADPFALRAMDRWLLGGLGVVGWEAPARAVALGLPAAAVLLAAAAPLDQIALGDALAHGRGVPVAWWRAAVLVAGAWLTAAVVAQTGPIAFVGLLVPHGVRAVMGPAHRRVLPASALAGAGFLVAADALARAIPLPGGGSELPVGVVTALAGGPAFLALLVGATAPRR